MCFQHRYPLPVLDKGGFWTVLRNKIFLQKNAVKGKPAKDTNGTPAGKGYFHNTSDAPNVKFKYKMEDKMK